MFEVKLHSVIVAPRDFVFAYVSDLSNAAHWMFGVTEAPVGPASPALGAVYESTIRLGPKTLSSRIEVVEWEQDKLFATESRSGVRNHSRWLFEDGEDGNTHMVVTIEYELPGPGGKALGGLIEPFIQIAVRQSEKAVARQAEAAYKLSQSPGTADG